MKIESENLNKNVCIKYMWEYLYKGLLFFCIGVGILIYQGSKYSCIFMINFGKMSYKLMGIMFEDKKIKKTLNIKKEKKSVKLYK